MKTYWLENPAKKAKRAVRRAKAVVRHVRRRMRRNPALITIAPNPARKSSRRRSPKKSVASDYHTQRGHNPMSHRKHRRRKSASSKWRRNPKRRSHWKVARRSSWSSHRRKMTWHSNPAPSRLKDFASPKFFMPALAIVGGMVAAFGLKSLVQRNAPAALSDTTMKSNILKYATLGGATLGLAFASRKMRQPLLGHAAIGAVAALVLEGARDAGAVSFAEPQLAFNFGGGAKALPAAGAAGWLDDGDYTEGAEGYLDYDDEPIDVAL
jgi:hypothetical protein